MEEEISRGVLYSEYETTDCHKCGCLIKRYIKSHFKPNFYTCFDCKAERKRRYMKERYASKKNNKTNN